MTVAALRALLPDGVVADDPALLAARAADRSGVPALGAPAVLVRPRTTADVAAVLRYASAERVPVVPQGGLTGLAGGANAVPGAILLDLSAMDRVVAVDEVDRSAVVQPGVLVADLQRAAGEHGLFYAPDPGSADEATIGGTVATNAGGMRCLKYGVTRDAVRSLEVVLADGSVVRTRPATVKGVAGLDLTSVIVGSEGTLAVVTEVTVALLPAPGPSVGVAGVFGSVAEALRAADAIVAGPHGPSGLELLDGVVLDAIRRLAPSSGIPEGAAAWLLVVTDERDGAAASTALDWFTGVLAAHGALAVERADDERRLDDLMAARRLFNQAMRELRGGSINEDVSVPRHRLPELVERVSALSSEIGLVIAVGGHVGDGNLHPVVSFDPGDVAQVAAARRAHERILALADELGGTVTGEHGIGVEKLSAVAVELPARLRELQRAVKAAFDPLGILNPGKKL